MKKLRITCKTELRLPYSKLNGIQGKLTEMTKERFEKLRALILKYGVCFALHVWKDGKGVWWILDGHGRAYVIRHLVEKEAYACPDLPCVAVEAKDKKEAMRKVLAARSSFNRATGEGLYEFMHEAGIPIDELDEYDLPDIDMKHYKEEFYEDAADEAEDDLPPVPKVATTKLGDLWTLGTHRLLCGDSTAIKDVERLMDGKLAEMVFTDPPYGVNYDGGTATVREKLAGDDSPDLYEAACKMAFKFSSPKSALYLWHAAATAAAEAAEAAEAAGWEIRSLLIWNKNQAQFGALSAQYKQKHEPAYYCFKRGKTVNWCGPTNEVTVWDCNRSPRNDFHPTQKPVELAARALTNHKASTVLDLFLGSGSTLIACEQKKRQGFGLELEPLYCDVILQRWANLTGKVPVRHDGVTWADLEKSPK